MVNSVWMMLIMLLLLLLLVVEIESSPTIPTGVRPCVIGGTQADGSITNQTECWDNLDSLWVCIPELSFQGYAMTSIQIGGVSCLVGGVSTLFLTPIKTVVCTNGSGWYPTYNITHNRTGAVALYGGSWVGVAGGGRGEWEGSPVQNVANAPLQSAWQTGSSTLPLPVSYAHSFSFNGSACVGGGDAGSGPIANTYCLPNASSSSLSTSSSSSWVPAPSLAFQVERATTVIWQGQECLVGGNVDSSGDTSCNAQCLQTDGTWTYQSLQVPGFIRNAANITLMGMTCVSGGVSAFGPGGSVVNTVWCVNESDPSPYQAWVPAPSFFYPRTLHTSFNLMDLAPTPPPTYPSMIPGRYACVAGSSSEQAVECYSEVKGMFETWPTLTIGWVDGAVLQINPSVACLSGGSRYAGQSMLKTLSIVCTNGTEWVEEINSFLTHPRTGAAAVYGPEWIGVVGGNVSNWEVSYGDYYTSDVEPVMFDGWTLTTTPLSSALSFASVITHNGTSCLVGGDVNGVISGQTICLSPPTTSTTPPTIPYSASWVDIGLPLSTPRTATTSLQLNGKWCVVGGVDISQSATNTVECLQQVAGVWGWAPGVSLPIPISYAKNLTIAGKPCVVGGETAGNSVYCYSSGGVWNYYNSLSIPRYHPMTFYLEVDGVIPPHPTPSPSLAPNATRPTGVYTCVSGGQTSGQTECFNPVTNTWEWWENLNIHSVDSAVIQMDNVTCLAGGTSKANEAPIASVYCTNGTAWLPGPSLIVPRQGATAVSGNGWVGVVGGADDWESFAVNANQLNPSLFLSPPLQGGSVNGVGGVANSVAFNIDGVLCLVGGYISTLSSPTVNRVCLLNTSSSSSSSPPTNAWTVILLAGLITDRYGHYGFLYQGKPCVVGGLDSGGVYLSTAECLLNSTAQFSRFPTLDAPFNTAFGVSFNIMGMQCVGGGESTTTSPSVPYAVWCLNDTTWVSGPSMLFPHVRAASYSIALNQACVPGTSAGVGGMCVNCPAGQYSNTMNAPQCSSCPPGSYAHIPSGSSTGATNCTQCPVGTASSGQGQVSCTQCGLTGQCPTTPTAAVGCTTCQAVVGCTWQAGVAVGGGVYMRYDVTCSPAYTQPLYASLHLVDGMTVNYSSPLPLILPCGNHDIQLSPIPFDYHPPISSSLIHDLPLSIPCDPTITDWENLLQNSLQSLQTAINNGDLGVTLQYGVVITECLAVNHPTNITRRKIFRSQLLSLLTQATITFPSSNELAFLTQEDLTIGGEIDPSTSIDILTDNSIPCTYANVQATLKVYESLSGADNDNDTISLADKYEKFCQRTMTLLNNMNSNSNSNSNSSNDDDDTIVIFTDHSVVVLHRGGVQDYGDSRSYIVGGYESGTYVNGSSNTTTTTTTTSTSTSRRLLTTTTVGEASSSSALGAINITARIQWPFSSITSKLNHSNTSSLNCVMIGSDSKILNPLTSTKKACESSSLVSLTCSANGQPFPIANLSLNDPLEITIPHRTPTAEETTQCVFYDNVTGKLSSEGCTTVSFLDRTVCRCVHATMFTIKFLPKPNVIHIADLNELTGANVEKHPMPLIVVLSLAFIFIFLFVWALARDKQEMSRTLRSVKVKGRKEASRREPTLREEWWKETRTSHLWISILSHRFGDPFSAKQRLACLTATVYATLMANGMFFQTGVKSFGASVCSTALADSISFPLIILFRKAAMIGLPENFQDTLFIDDSTPERRPSRMLRYFAYFLSAAITITSFVLIIALGMQFDLGSVQLQTINCVPIETFSRDKYSRKWLERCIVSLVLDVFVVRAVVSLAFVLFQRLVKICRSKYFSSPPQGAINMDPLPTHVDVDDDGGKKDNTNNNKGGGGGGQSKRRSVQKSQNDNTTNDNDNNNNNLHTDEKQQNSDGNGNSDDPTKTNANTNTNTHTNAAEKQAEYERQRELDRENDYR